MRSKKTLLWICWRYVIISYLNIKASFDSLSNQKLHLNSYQQCKYQVDTKAHKKFK